MFVRASPRHVNCWVLSVYLPTPLWRPLAGTGASTRDALQDRPVRAGPTHLPEHTPRLVDQALRRVKLEDLSVSEDQNAIVIEHGLQPMRDRDYNGASEFFSDRALDL